MFEQNARVLCLHGLYGSQTESKLTLLSGQRAIETFEKKALLAFFNIFSNPRDPEVDKHMRDYLDYLISLQNHYMARLEKFGLGQGTSFPAATRHTASRTLLRDRHRALCAMDGTNLQEDFGDWEKINRRIAEGIDAPPDLQKDLADHLYWAHASYDQLTRFEQRCADRGIVPFHSSTKSMGEFIAFAAHLARGFLFGIHDKPGNLQKDFRSARRHLKRVALDMQKSILTTAFRRAVKDGNAYSLPKDLVRDVLAVRQEELRLAPDDDGKAKVYKDVVKKVVNIPLT